jgi:hypothetical protein
MKWFAAHVPGLVLAALAASPALAADGPCPRMIVAANAEVRALWPEVNEHVHEAFDARDDIDRCARVELSRRSEWIDVEVALPDGRIASRLGLRQQDVVPTLAALLLVPERQAQAPEPQAAEGALELPQPSAAASPQPVPPRIARLEAALRDSPERLKSVQPEPEHVRFEFSLATGARVGDGHAVLGLGVLSFLDILGWLVGFEGKAESYARIADGRSASALALAVLGGRRLRFGTVALDLIAGPRLALFGSSSTNFVKSADAAAVAPPPEPMSTDGFVPRMLVGAHLSFSTDAVVRSFVGVDGEFGTAHAVGDDSPGVPHRLPSWTLGLALGATAGTL